MNPRVSPLIYIGVFLVSAVALGLEILMTRLMALMMWHHFTYVVIGVALLGFGAAGSWVMLRPTGAPPGRRLARHALYLALAVPISYTMITSVRFAPLSLGEDPRNFVALLLIYVMIAVPFFFAGLVVCDAIQTFRERVGSVYFADLLGAGAGAAVAVGIMEATTAPGAVVLSGALAGLASAAFALQGGIELRKLIDALLALGVVLVILFWVYPLARAGKLDPPLAPSKELTMLEPTQTLERSAWNPLARIDVSKELVIPPGMGGGFPKDTAPRQMRFVFQDGSAPTMLFRWNGDPKDLAFLARANAAAGHVALAARGARGVEEMAIGVGGGVDLLIALQFDPKHVTGVEINASTLRFLEETYGDYTGGLAKRAEVELVHAEGRHFARASGRSFDLIQLSGVDTYTALSTGAYTLSESYLYTREAVEDFLHALRPEGILSYSRIAFPDRPRETLRLAATALEALERLGVHEARRHLFVSIAQGWASLLVSRSPFEADVLAALRDFSKQNGYEIHFDPDRQQKNAFHDLLDRDPPEREAFYASYPFKVRPAVDDKPFFFNYWNWAGLLRTSEYGGHAYRQSYPIGHLCLLLSLVQTVVLGAFFILRPLRRLGRVGTGTDTLSALLYFAALGLGFIAVEIVLLQRFVLFLGHPTISLTTVLPAMLISAGLGSLSVRPDTDPRDRIRRLLLWIPVAILAGWLVTSLVLDLLLGLGLVLRILLAVLVLAPIGFVLGQAFPCGVRLLGDERPELVPWVWAINAFMTVLGSTAAVLVAMEAGFTLVIIATVPVYLLGMLALLGAFRAGAAPGASDVPAGAVPLAQE